MPINAKPKMRRLLRLRTILWMVMLSVLLLPIGSLYFFRFYENELVRKTEIELISQSAVLATVYRELIGKNSIETDPLYTPVFPSLDLSKRDAIKPPRPHARSSTSYNQTEGYALAQQAGKSMQRILRNTQRVTLSGIRILDASGVVVAGRGDLNKSLAHVEEVKLALKGQFSSILRQRISDEPPPSIASLSRGTGVRVFTAFPIMDQGTVYGVVYLSRTPQNILKHLYSIKEKVILLGLILLGLTSLIVMFISSRLSRPIRELIDQTQKVTRGEAETVEVLKHPGTRELSMLSTSFAEMSQTLHERSQYIQQFAAHVSHEFKTPLTSMQGSLELLEEHIDEMPAEQRQRFIDNLQEDTERLKNLVSRLLEQARADSLSTSSESTNLLKRLTILKSRYADSKLTLEYKESETDLNVTIPSNALESILANLFDNSLQHGATHILINAQQKNGRLEISVHDNGSGVSNANQDKIFTPFFTTRRDSGGTGLGLGIIESILKASNGTINNISVKKGALFVLNLGLE
jgi:signal transduction histidine kinase